MMNDESPHIWDISGLKVGFLGVWIPIGPFDIVFK